MIALAQPRGFAAPLADASTEELGDELRRRGLLVVDGRQPRVLPGLIVYPDGRSIEWRGRTIGFSRREGDVLVALAARWPIPISCEQLTRAIWGSYACGQPSTVYVRYIRGKAPGLVETLRHGGYRLALGEVAS